MGPKIEIPGGDRPHRPQDVSHFAMGKFGFILLLLFFFFFLLPSVSIDIVLLPSRVLVKLFCLKGVGND